MKANPEESCEDCVHWRRTGNGYTDSCLLKQADRRKDAEACDEFKPNQWARIARSVGTLAWNAEEQVNMMASWHHAQGKKR